MQLWRCLLGAFRQRLPSLFTCDLVVLDALLEFAESGHGQTLSRGGLLVGHIMVALHVDVDGNVLLDLIRGPLLFLFPVFVSLYADNPAITRSAPHPPVPLCIPLC